MITRNLGYKKKEMNVPNNSGVLRGVENGPGAAYVFVTIHQTGDLSLASEPLWPCV